MALLGPKLYYSTGQSFTLWETNIEPCRYPNLNHSAGQSPCGPLQMQSEGHSPQGLMLHQDVEGINGKLVGIFHREQLAVPWFWALLVHCWVRIQCIFLGGSLMPKLHNSGNSGTQGL